MEKVEGRGVAPLAVLAAEDNTINQRLISAILSHCGHRFVIVPDDETDTPCAATLHISNN